MEKTIRNKMMNLLNSRTTEQLYELSIKFFEDDSDNSVIVLETIMDLLETRVPEKEFISFCNSL